MLRRSVKMGDGSVLASTRTCRTVSQNGDSPLVVSENNIGRPFIVDG